MDIGLLGCGGRISKKKNIKHFNGKIIARNYKEKLSESVFV